MPLNYDYGVQTSNTLQWLCYQYDKKKKLKLYLLVVLILLKMFRHTKISVLKIGMLMSKTDCINLCKQKAH